jgi:hypothetical protein
MAHPGKTVPLCAMVHMTRAKLHCLRRVGWMAVNTTMHVAPKMIAACA